MQSVHLKTQHIKQTEGHTCGYCAAHVVYRYYGMDPKALQLREYLGTDHLLPYHFPARERVEAWMEDSDLGFSGTFPTDMLAVLHWDGFDTEWFANGYANYRTRLRNHLSKGHPAIAILYSCAHWVVIDGMDDEGVWITDGILWDDVTPKSHQYLISHEGFANEEHGIVLVSRGDIAAHRQIRDMTYLDFVREYGRGIFFVAAMVGRNVPRWISGLLPGKTPEEEPEMEAGEEEEEKPSLLHNMIDTFSDWTGLRLAKENLSHPDRRSCVTLRIPGYKQLQSYTCGFSASANVLHYFQPDADLTALYDSLDSETRNGTVERQVCDALRKYGITVQPRLSLDYADILDCIDKDKPLIIAIKTNVGDHWVVVYGYDRKARSLFVSGLGWMPHFNIKEIRFTEFLTQWIPRGNGLVCGHGTFKKPRNRKGARRPKVAC